MTKIRIVAAISGILCGCGGNASEIKNAPDYVSTYAGIVLSASGMGMIVTTTIENGAYIKKTVYVGKEGVFEDDKRILRDYFVDKIREISVYRLASAWHGGIPYKNKLIK